MRKLIFRIHLYAALALGLAIVIMGFTGAVIVFEPDIERLANPGLFRTVPVGKPLPISEIQRRFSESQPQVRWRAIRLANAPDRLHVVQDGATQYFLNPYTGQVAGTKAVPNGFVFLRKLHMNLALGKPGAAINRIGSGVLAFLAVSGMYLWWPFKRWRISWKTTRRLAFDTHLAAGAFASLFIAALGVTGLLLSGNFSLGAALFRESDPNYKPPPRDVPSQVQSGVTPITADEAIRTARQAMPAGTPLLVNAPSGPASTYSIVMRLPGDLSTMGRSWVNVDQYSGKAVKVVTFQHVPAAARGKDLTRSIHTGDVFGYPTKILMALASMMAVVQSLTGVYLWWKKRRGTSARNPMREQPVPMGAAQ